MKIVLRRFNLKPELQNSNQILFSMFKPHCYKFINKANEVIFIDTKENRYKKRILYSKGLSR